MSAIYHMLPAAEWMAQDPAQPLVADSLATEGFIHFSGELEILPTVANRFYASIPGDYVVLVVDPARLNAEVRWEPSGGHLFPHLYGPLNLDAVTQILPFPRDEDGNFLPLIAQI
jgi:uncharacterized protein (DUF952 family)